LRCEDFRFAPKVFGACFTSKNGLAIRDANCATDLSKFAKKSENLKFTSQELEYYYRWEPKNVVNLLWAAVMAVPYLTPF